MSKLRITLLIPIALLSLLSAFLAVAGTAYVAMEVSDERVGSSAIASGSEANLAFAHAFASDDRELTMARVLEVQSRKSGLHLSVFDLDGAFVAGNRRGLRALTAGQRDEVKLNAMTQVIVNPVAPKSVLVPITTADGGHIGYLSMAAPLVPNGSSALIHAARAGTVLALFSIIVLVLGLFGTSGVVRSFGVLSTGIAHLHAGQYQFKLPAGPVRALRPQSRQLNELGERLRRISSSSRFVNDVVQSMVDSLIVVDRQARIRALNQATLDLLGYEESELIGRTASLICVADGHHLTSDQMANLLGAGSKNDHEVTYLAKNGTRIPISLSGSSIRDEAGETTGYVCIGTDITHRKEAETEREQLHRRVVATSRQAGMAEVATGVLHNVGNVLNSVNVAASIVEETLRHSKITKLEKAKEMLEAHEEDLATFLTQDPTGRQLPKYIGTLSDHLSGERERLLTELKSLTNHIGHIKDIISVQQTISKTTGVVEPVEVAMLIDDALTMASSSMTRDGIRVRKVIAHVPNVVTDKHKVLQILVNLISNARDAIRDRKVKSGTIGIKVEETGRGEVDIAVTDNGIGIEPGNLTDIFKHGFTTKKDGHGFGLHSAALAAKELQGELRAHSEGPGRGATFTLTLPVQQPAENRGAA